MKNKTVLSLVLFLASSLLASGQMPEIKIKDSKEGSVLLQSLSIDIEVMGNIATSKFKMSFRNESARILEGELSFPLPDGVSISGYALDINGKMRQAVAVPKGKATQVFETIEKRQVDPGLIEQIEGNNFRTRIYPLPPNGVRSIEISYEQELKEEDAQLLYRLPMHYTKEIENFAVKLKVIESREKPQIEGENSENLQFDRVGRDYIAEFSRENYRPSPLLSFSVPKSKKSPQLWMQAASGSQYFLFNCLPKGEKREKSWSDHIEIIWDNSLSGEDRALKKELAVLEQIIKQKKTLKISLSTLNDSYKKRGEYNIKDGNWELLRKALDEIIYDGGSNYQAIKLSQNGAKEILFFSDGLSNLSEGDIFKTNKKDRRIHSIVSTPRADYGLMKWIAYSTAGKFINLNALSDKALEEELKNESLLFLGIENGDQISELYPSTKSPVGSHFSIAGISASEKTEFTLLFGYGNKITERIAVKLDAKTAAGSVKVYRLWAQKKIADMDFRASDNEQEITELAQQFHLLSRYSSLLVLEDINDYVNFKIVPPEELREEYYKRLKTFRENNKTYTLLPDAIEKAKELSKWWAQKPKAKNRFPSPDLARERSFAHENVELVAEITDTQDMFVSENESEMKMAELSANRKEGEMAQQSGKKEKKQAKITVIEIKQDKEYLKGLTKESEKDYQSYLELRKEYGSTPGFYFDMADWFFRLNDKEKALRILTCIAELEIENASLYRLLAYRLKEYKAYKTEEYICRKLVKWRPMDAQSHRDHALALADRGKPQEALDVLYNILTCERDQRYSSNAERLVEVIVSEINQLISKHKNLELSQIDEKIFVSLPVDIRVALNWNMDNTDIDLHIVDPDNEDCSYTNKFTALGGRISNDITNGFGPEQFMLRKAKKGKYAVFVNYYGDRRVDLGGPATLMLEISVFYGEKEERREVQCLQLSQAKRARNRNLIKIAEFEF